MGLTNWQNSISVLATRGSCLGVFFPHINWFHELDFVPGLCACVCVCVCGCVTLDDLPLSLLSQKTSACLFVTCSVSFCKQLTCHLADSTRRSLQSSHGSYDSTPLVCEFCYDFSSPGAVLCMIKVSIHWTFIIRMSSLGWAVVYPSWLWVRRWGTPWNGCETIASWSMYSIYFTPKEMQWTGQTVHS